MGLYKAFSKTQDWTIEEQLEHGIRYLDIRLGTNEKTSEEDINQLYVVHDIITCVDIKNDVARALKLSDVFDICINFLTKHDQETIIIAIKDDNIKSEKIQKSLGKIIEKATLLNQNKITDTKLYSDFFYKKDKIPLLQEVKGKIVVLSRKKIQISDERNLGTLVEIPNMGECRNYPHSSCCPRFNDLDIRIQDNYNLDATEKWRITVDMFDNNVQLCNNKYDYKSTINFMNMAEMDTSNAATILNDIFDASIEQSANYVNNRLTEYIIKNPEKIRNYWFIMDYPNTDSIRAIYQSNDPNKTEFQNNKAEVDNWFQFAWTDVKYFISLAPVETIFDIIENIFKRNGNNAIPCLQRKITNAGNEIIKTNYKCVKNNLNQWYFKSSGKGKYISII
ncbi:PLC-like phosphodiesterase [Neocallimastix lanati (nom. inval.)]|nr:PLC-like phosphodiesterase [Neocallimastix sp. JGI-2020a]